nr:putative ribonuclease H-like domain-containing protein [Tanacetum cinerariifolium]
KQHKVSFKSKLLNSISQSLFMLHMDLFGPTSMSSIMHKKYYLVITDDFSRFTWVFFLATKDEISRILKHFIIEIENLVEKKVKIIKCDNGTKFKNRFMNEFYKEKCIKREYSVARTPQQNRVAERRNRTLIEAARTMTRKVEENLHIIFVENKPMIAGGGPEWLFDIDSLLKSMNYAPVPTVTNSNNFAGKGVTFDAGQSSMETESSQDRIYSDGHNKDNHGPSQASKSDDQERPNADSSFKTVNTDGPVNTATPTYADYPNDPLMPDLEDTGIVDNTYDDRDEGVEADYNILETIEAIRLFLAYALFMDFTVYQMDVKSAFLYGTIDEEFLGSRLISWQCKKQTILANSTTEAEYIDASNCHGQARRVDGRIKFQAVDVTDDSLAVPEHTTFETPMNMSPENKAHFLAKKEAIHLILTGIGDEIYSTVDAWQTAQEMFVTIVKEQHKVDEVSYHKLFDILKQYQNEVNELRAERLAKNANPLALVATAQTDQEQYYQTSRSHRSSAPSSKPSIPTRSHTSTRHKGKEIAKPITPPSETASEEDRDPDKLKGTRIHKIIRLSLQNTSRRSINLPTTTSEHHQTPRMKMWTRHHGSKVVQQSSIRCFNCKEYGHFAKECRKPKRVKNSAYHKEKMLLCNNTCLVETDDSNVIPDSTDMCEDDIQNEQNDVESNDERVAIANLKLDVDENKKIQKQLNKANTTLAQELKECKAILAETSKSLGESISVRDSCLVAFQTKQTEFEKYNAFNDHTIDYGKLKHKLNEAL